MYNNYLMLNPSKKEGTGVFTRIDIPRNSPLIEFSGEIYSREEAPHQNPKLLQIGNNIFVLPSGVPSFVNHSCSPNCFLNIVGLRAFLYSLKNIKAGEELTFDYSTSSTDDLADWSMKCNCGSINCRKNISGFQHLDTETQKNYIERGLLPLFMRKQNIL